MTVGSDSLGRRRRRGGFRRPAPERRHDGVDGHAHLHEAEHLVRGATRLHQLQQPVQVSPAERRRQHGRGARHAGLVEAEQPRGLREHERIGRERIGRESAPGRVVGPAHVPQPRAQAVEAAVEAGQPPGARAGVSGHVAVHAQRERVALHLAQLFHHRRVLGENLVAGRRHLLLDAPGADVGGLEVGTRGSLGLGHASFAGPQRSVELEPEVVFAEFFPRLVESEGGVDRLVVDVLLGVGLGPGFGPELGVEVVLDRVVGAAGQELGDGRPAVAELLVGGHYGAILRLAEVVAPERGIQLVAPSQAAGFAAAVGDSLGDERPVARAVGHHQHAQPGVLLRGWKGRKTTGEKSRVGAKTCGVSSE